mgnify:CR=1 FL=1
MSLGWYNAIALDQTLNKFRKAWGFIFRTVFIPAVGWFGYNYFEPKNLGDVPLSQLTLNGLFSNILGVGIALLCLVWFFKKFDNDDGLSYEEWGNFGLGVIGLGVLLYFFIL